MLKAKSAGQMTYMVNFLSEADVLDNYRFILLINMVADEYLKKCGIHIPGNVNIYRVASKYSYGVASYIWQVFNLPRIVKEVRPDYVYAPTHIAYKVRNTKTILAMDNMAIPHFLKIDAPLKLRASLFLKNVVASHTLRRADKVVAVSNYVKDFLKRNIGKDEKDIFVAYHMVNSLHRDNDSRLEQYSDIGENDYIVFVPGSYYRYKKFHALLNYLEAVKLPRNAKVIFAGDEADTKYLTKLKQYKTKAFEAIFKVSLSIQEMKFFYKVARLVILSSQVEACPNIALEALANNSKVLASNIQPFKEILGDFAVYFDTNDKDDFIKKFEMAISSEPDLTVRAKQMKKVSSDSNMLDILHFCESD